jgi:hypothetical protein
MPLPYRSAVSRDTPEREISMRPIPLVDRSRRPRVMLMASGPSLRHRSSGTVTTAARLRQPCIARVDYRLAEPSATAFSSVRRGSR